MLANPLQIHLLCFDLKGSATNQRDVARRGTMKPEKAVEAIRGVRQSKKITKDVCGGWLHWFVQ